MSTTIRQGFAAIAAGMIFVAFATPRLNAVETTPAPAAPILPKPVLVLIGLEYYAAGGKEWTRYKYTVTNRAEYPNELFAASPDLPPCGTNTNASRTWVDFYDERGQRLYGFCALGNRDNLNSIWFAVETSVAPPKMVYIKLNDRKTDTICQSNLAPTSRDPRLQ